MLKKLANGEIKPRIIPGSTMHYNTPKSEDVCDSYGKDPPCGEGKNYVNTVLEGYENEDYLELSRKALPSSNMSCVDSLTNYAASMTDLKDLNLDERKLLENYKFKDPSDTSNNLAIAKHKLQIVQMINANCVVLVSGPTGCGKSTQVPQFILDDCMNRQKYCNIIVTQPRRIAAISVCKQVNYERNWKSGLLVGYQVGRKKDYDPNVTKVLYCTTGILLQKIISEKSLSEYTHIILDEVHERTIEMDFLLLIIKKLLKSNSPSTRVILMSATAQIFKLSDYFSDYYGPPYNCYVKAQQISIVRNPIYNVSLHYLDELYQLIPSAREMEFDKPQITKAGYDTAISLVKGFSDIEKGYDNKASVLIFLPGIFEIEEMHRLMEHTMATENIKWILLPLHSSITSEEQDRVFEKPPLNYRKIILTTNIAESSITVPDVSYVIDFCLMKQLKNEMKSNYTMLIMRWASKSNCIQRSGRVGRVADGRVYRLIPEKIFVDDFFKEELPEMSRCSLSRVVLMSKMLDMGTPKQLLATAMDPPDLKNIVLTILTLKQVGALLPTVNGVINSLDGDITFMGKVMAQLPLEPPMSKLIYFGYIFNILNEAMIMACGLSIKSLFSQPFNKRLEAYTQKLSWANNSYSDPISYIAPYQNWLQRKPEFDRNRHIERSWAQKNYIQLSAIRELHDLIDDVSSRLKQHFSIVANSGNMKWNIREEKAMACKVILAGAFYPNYFNRGITNSYMDEHEVLKLLDGHDPNRTVFFSGFPNDQPKQLYKETIENIFPEKLTGKPTAHFNNSNKIYIEFPTSNLQSNEISNDNEKGRNQLILPGNISFGVYVALKMRQLRFDFSIPLFNPSDALKRVQLRSSELVAAQKMSIQKLLPIQKSIIEEINTNTIDITVSHFQSVGCFWAQLFDDYYKGKLTELWKLVNEGIDSLKKVIPKDLSIGDFYIVIYRNEKYRAKLMYFLHGPPEKYQFFLIDFGETIQLFINDIFNILNNNDKKRVDHFPALAFQCKIAKIRPVVHNHLESDWSDDANSVFDNYGGYTKKMHGTIYSLVNGVVSFENLHYLDGDNFVSIPDYLISKSLAYQTEETLASKIDHANRSKKIKNTKDKINQECNNLPLNLKSLTFKESHKLYCLKGPFSPLKMAIHGINHKSRDKNVQIESQSVNSVLLDTDPSDYHERLFVAGRVCMNEIDRLTMWDSTMMPNIPGIPAIICLMFSPCVEIRYNSSYTKMIGAICGLGYDPETLRPLFVENDIEIKFDIVIDHNLLNKINIIRLLLNKCVNPEDEVGPGDIFQIQYSLQNSLTEIFSLPYKFKTPETIPTKNVWGIIPKSRLQSPYQDNSSMNNPMAGSDVYKLIWGAILSPVLSTAECKLLLHKLCKIKRLEECFRNNSFTSDTSSEELFCPLCHLSFANNTSMKMHCSNFQHKERYKNCKEELECFYRGPFSDIAHL